MKTNLQTVTRTDTGWITPHNINTEEIKYLSYTKNI